MDERTAAGGEDAAVAAGLLDIWPALALRDPIETPAAILRRFASEAEASPSRTLGTRDRALLRCRRSILGDRLDMLASCPRCATEVEAEASCSALMTTAIADERGWTMRVGAYRLEVRPVDVAGAATAASAATVEEGRLRLLEQTVIRAERAGRPIPARALPPAVVSALSAALAEHDEGAELVLTFECPACALTWTDVLDVAQTVAAEFAGSARQLMADVDRLARAYGWTEAEILALPRLRRAAYIALVEA